MSAIVLSFAVIAVIVTGWTAAVRAFYTRQDVRPLPQASDRTWR